MPWNYPLAVKGTTAEGGTPGLLSYGLTLLFLGVLLASPARLPCLSALGSVPQRLCPAPFREGEEEEEEEGCWGVKTKGLRLLIARGWGWKGFKREAESSFGCRGGATSEIISCFRLCLLKWWPCCRVPGRPPASQRSRHLAQALGEGRAGEVPRCSAERGVPRRAGSTPSERKTWLRRLNLGCFHGVCFEPQTCRCAA